MSNKKADVEFEITFKYIREVEEYDDQSEKDSYTLEQEIALAKEYLETQREDLYDALSYAELIEVKIINIKEK